MSSITHCPYCNTIFRVSSDQLDICSGIVRCGICHRVFNGIDQLLETSNANKNSVSANVIERNVFTQTESANKELIVSEKENSAPEIPAKNSEAPTNRPSREKGKITSFKVSVDPILKNSVTPTKVAESTQDNNAAEAERALLTSESTTSPDTGLTPSEEVSVLPDTEKTGLKEDNSVLKEEAQDPEENILSSKIAKINSEIQASRAISIEDEKEITEIDSLDTAPHSTNILEAFKEELSSISLDLSNVPSSSLDAPTKPLDQIAFAESETTDNPDEKSSIPIVEKQNNELISDNDQINLPESETTPFEYQLYNDQDDDHYQLALSPRQIDTTEPDFIALARKKQRSSLTIRILLGLASILLLVLLLAQATYTFSDRIIAWWPPAEPYVNEACEILSCPNRQQARISSLSIESSELKIIPSTPGTYSLDLLIRNNSSSIQYFPHLELTLMDEQKRPLVRRVFAPENYFPDTKNIKAGFGPHSQQEIKLYFEFQQNNAVDYRVYLFYP